MTTTIPGTLAGNFISSTIERKIAGKMPAQGYVRIGRAYIINHTLPTVDRESIPKEEVQQNLEKLSAAIEASQEELNEVKEKLDQQPIEVGLELGKLIYFYEQNLPELKKEISRKVERSLMNAQDATMAVIEEMEVALKGTVNERIIDDYKALGDKIIRNILKIEGHDVPHRSLEDAPEGCFVIADKLSPSDCIYLVSRNIRGLIIQHGAASGHVAVIAKELGIPALFTEADIKGVLHDDMPIIIDGQHGVAYLNPSTNTIEKYEAHINKEERKIELRKKYKDKKITSKDGVDCRVYSNINFTTSAHRAKENMSDGIGLYRTEWLFTSNSEEPSIELQRQAYNYVINAVDGHATTFRLLDTEGDKNEKNWLRSANRWDLMKNQVKAIMLAAVDNNVMARILLPVVRGREELAKIRSYIENAKTELTDEGIVPPETKLGMMVEIPSPANEIEDYIEYADNFSIGSNDLIAWICGQVRNSEEHEEYEDPTNRTVMTMLEKIISAAEAADKPVSLCGRIASNPKYISLLMGLGLTKFSAGVENVLDIKETIENINVSEAKTMVKKLKAELDRTTREGILDNFNRSIDVTSLNIEAEFIQVLD